MDWWVTVGYVLLEASRAAVFVDDGEPVEAEIVGYDRRLGSGSAAGKNAARRNPDDPR